jgi:hypothetical protein
VYWTTLQLGLSPSSTVLMLKPQSRALSALVSNTSLKTTAQVRLLIRGFFAVSLWNLGVRVRQIEAALVLRRLCLFARVRLFEVKGSLRSLLL